MRVVLVLWMVNAVVGLRVRRAVDDAHLSRLDKSLRQLEDWRYNKESELERENAHLKLEVEQLRRALRDLADAEAKGGDQVQDFTQRLDHLEEKLNPGTTVGFGHIVFAARQQELEEAGKRVSMVEEDVEDLQETKHRVLRELNTLRNYLGKKRIKPKRGRTPAPYQAQVSADKARRLPLSDRLRSGGQRSGRQPRPVTTRTAKSRGSVHQPRPLTTRQQAAKNRQESRRLREKRLQLRQCPNPPCSSG